MGNVENAKGDNALQNYLRLPVYENLTYLLGGRYWQL